MINFLKMGSRYKKINLNREIFIAIKLLTLKILVMLSGEIVACFDIFNEVTSLPDFLKYY